MRQTRLFICLLLLFALGAARVGYAQTAGACATSESGLGGTGATAEGRGIGGTGVQAQERGIGGTGVSGDGKGIGGTGKTAEDRGIGGTGRMADDRGIGGTGIVGTITSFGSICVNGVKIEYTDTTPVDVNGQPASVNAFKIGQVVAAETVEKNGKVFANKVSIEYPVQGPVTRVGPGGKQITVMGQPVRVVGGPKGGPLKVGQFVRVSGLRRPNGELVGTQIERVPAGASARISGTLRQRPGGGLAIGQVPINMRDAPAGRQLEGKRVTATGRWSGKAIDTPRIVADKVDRFDGKAKRVNVQGFVGQRVGADAFEIGDYLVDVPESTVFEGGGRKGLRSGRRVIVKGRLGPNSRVSADSVRLEVGPGGEPIEGESAGTSGEDGDEDDSDEQGLDDDSADDDSDEDSDNSGSGSAGKDEGDDDRSGRDDGDDDRDSSGPGSGRDDDVSDPDDLREDKSGSSRDDTDSRSGSEVKELDVERVDKSSGKGRGGRAPRPEKVDKPDKSGSSDRPDRLERLERSGRSERPDKVARPDKVERPDKIDRPDKVERPDRPEKVDRSGRPERPERIDRSGRPERPERPDRSGPGG